MTHGPALVWCQIGDGLAAVKRRQITGNQVGRRDQRGATQFVRIERVQRPSVTPQAPGTGDDIAGLVGTGRPSARLEGTQAGSEAEPARIPRIHRVGRQQMVPHLIAEGGPGL